MAPKKAAEATHHAIGDQVLGRIKGYPPWPARIVDPDKEFLTKDVLNAKKGKKNVLLVRYYPDATYSWSPSGELKPLPRKAIDAYVATHDKGGKGSALLIAYKTAQDPEGWEAEQGAKQDRMRNSNEDELDGDDDDDGPEDRPTGSKRKAGKGKAGANKKAKPDPKKAQKKDKKADKKDDAILEEGGKKCKEWRHKLQRAFLSDNLPAVEQMGDFDKIFAEMEAFTFQGEWLTATKLPKVLRRIHTLDKLPGEDKYHIKKRAGELVDNWKTLVPEDKGADEPASAAKTDAAAGAQDGDLTVADQTAVDDSMAVDPPENQEAPEADEAKPAEPAPEAAAAEPAPAPAQEEAPAADAPKVNGEAEPPAVNGDAQEPAAAAQEGEAAPQDVEMAPAPEASKAEADAPKADADAPAAEA